MKKKLLVMAASLVVAAVLAAGATLAYFTDRQVMEVQTITTGKVDIEVEGGTLDLPVLVPGAPVSFVNDADLKVTLAADSNDAYIRIKPVIEVTQNDLPLANRTVYHEVMGFFNEKLNIHTDGYIKLVDETTFLKLDDQTVSKTVGFNGEAKLPTSWGNEYTNISVKIDFVVEAIQADYTDAANPFAGNTIVAYN